MESVRHVFIVNPVAGHGSNEEKIRRAVSEAFTPEENCTLRVTAGPKDAERIAREEAAAGGDVRLYACGGDGTLNEVVNGAAGYANAAVTVVPVGSGNDYLRNFGNREDFLDLAVLKTGPVLDVDLVKVGDRLSISLCSAGFDAEVAANLDRFKKMPMVSGSMAYVLSAFYCLLHRMRTHFAVSVDGVRTEEGDYLLCVAADGKWYGGSFLAAPRAEIDDGVLDFVLVTPMSRPAFVKMIGQYKAGHHEGIAGLRHFTGKKLELVSDREFAVNYDGETMRCRRIGFEIQPGAARFFMPEALYRRHMGKTLANSSYEEAKLVKY